MGLPGTHAVGDVDGFGCDVRIAANATGITPTSPHDWPRSTMATVRARIDTSDHNDQSSM